MYIFILDAISQRETARNHPYIVLLALRDNVCGHFSEKYGIQASFDVVRRGGIICLKYKNRDKKGKVGKVNF